MPCQKKFLHCIMLVVLSPCFTSIASATSIVNLDSIAHEVTLEIVGSETTIMLKPNQRWDSNAYPIRIKHKAYITPALERFGEYAIWPGGNIALQFNRKSSNKRY